jgi:hypothetical protein
VNHCFDFRHSIYRGTPRTFNSNVDLSCSVGSFPSQCHLKAK